MTNTIYVPWEHILNQFPLFFEEEKQALTAEEIKLITYWWEHDQHVFKTIPWRDAEDVLGYIMTNIFFMTMYFRGAKHDPKIGARVEDMEYVIAKCSPAFLQRIKFLDTHFINPTLDQGGRQDMQSVPWTRLPHNISLLTNMKWIYLTGAPIVDLEPLRGMDLHLLCLAGTKAKSLEPVAGMPISFLRIMGTDIDSLKPIEGSEVLTYIPVANTPLGKNAIDSLESLSYLCMTDLSGTKISIFPENINRAIHQERGKYESKQNITPPKHTKFHNWMESL